MPRRRLVIVGRRSSGTGAEVVLHRPHRAEAHPVGRPDLLHGLAVRPLLGRALAVGVRPLPGLRYVDLVQDIQVHAVPPVSSGEHHEADLTRCQSIRLQEPAQARKGALRNHRKVPRNEHAPGCDERNDLAEMRKVAALRP
jgi:hypothetical protein